MSKSESNALKASNGAMWKLKWGEPYYFVQTSDPKTATKMLRRKNAFLVGEDLADGNYLRIIRVDFKKSESAPAFAHRYQLLYLGIPDSA